MPDEFGGIEVAEPTKDQFGGELVEEPSVRPLPAALSSPNVPSLGPGLTPFENFTQRTLPRVARALKPAVINPLEPSTLITAVPNFPGAVVNAASQLLHPNEAPEDTAARERQQMTQDMRSRGASDKEITDRLENPLFKSTMPAPWRVSDESLKDSGVFAKLGAGVGNAAADLVDFMTSPAGVLTAMTGGVAGAALEPGMGAEAARIAQGIHRGTATAFALDMAKNDPETLQQIQDAIKKGEYQKAVQGSLGLAMSKLIQGGAAKGWTGKPHVAPELSAEETWKPPGWRVDQEAVRRTLPGAGMGGERPVPPAKAPFYGLPLQLDPNVKLTPDEQAWEAAQTTAPLAAEAAPEATPTADPVRSPTTEEGKEPAAPSPAAPAAPAVAESSSPEAPAPEANPKPLPSDATSWDFDRVASVFGDMGSETGDVITDASRKALMASYRAAMEKAVENKEPVNAYGWDQDLRNKVPEGYVLEGDRYVYKPEAKPDAYVVIQDNEPYGTYASQGVAEHEAKKLGGNVRVVPKFLGEVSGSKVGQAIFQQQADAGKFDQPPTPVVEQAEVSLEAPPEPPVVTGLDPNKHVEADVPVADIHLSEDVPNFKEGSNPRTGIVPGQELGGKLDQVGFPPIVLWRRADGRLEVITGRHRLELARRTGEKTIKSHIMDEASGFTKDMALRLDAWSNIKDGQGTVEDYAHYFKHDTQLTREQAEAEGLLSRVKGRTGWKLGRDASDDLYAAWKMGRVDEKTANAIVSVAPGDAVKQQLGLKLALEGKGAEFIRARLERERAKSESPVQTDLFGNPVFDDAKADSEAENVAAIRRGLKENIQAGQNAARNPEAAARAGIDVKHPDKARAQVEAWKAELERWEGAWWLDSELVAKAKGGEPAKGEPAKPVAKPEAPSLQLDKAESVQEQNARLAQESAARKAKADREKLAEQAAKPLVGSVGDIGQGDLLGGGDLLSGAPKKPPTAPAVESPKPPVKPDPARLQILRLQMDDLLPSDVRESGVISSDGVYQTPKLSREQLEDFKKKAVDLGWNPAFQGIEYPNGLVTWSFRRVEAKPEAPKPTQAERVATPLESELSPREIELLNAIENWKKPEGEFGPIYPNAEAIGATPKEWSSLLKKGLMDKAWPGILSMKARFDLDRARENAKPTQPAAAKAKPTVREYRTTETPLPTKAIQHSINRALQAADLISGNTKKSTLENALSTLTTHASKLGIEVPPVGTYFSNEAYRRAADAVRIGIGQKYGTHPTEELRAKRDAALGKEPTPAQAKAEETKPPSKLQTLADSIRAKKQKNTGEVGMLGMNESSRRVYNLALETMARIIETTEDVAKAIEAAVTMLREHAAKEKLPWTEAEIRKEVNSLAGVEEAPGQASSPERPTAPVPADQPATAPASAEKQARPAPKSEEQDTTGIKLTKTAEARAERNLDPLATSPKESQQQWLDAAQARMTADPAWVDNLAKELADKPRNISPEEAAGLNIAYRAANSRYTDVTTRFFDAMDRGDTESAGQGRIESALLADRMEMLEEAAKRSGEVWGRAGVARQIELKRDMSLAAIERRWRESKGGSPLTEDERRTAADWAKRVADLDQKLAVSENLRREADLKRADAEARANQAPPAIHPAILERAQRFVDTVLKPAGDAARDRIRARMGTMGAAVDPAWIKDAAIIGAEHLGRGVVESAKWADAVIKDCGAWAQDNLEEIRSRSEKLLESELAQKFNPQQAKQIKDATAAKAKVAATAAEKQAAVQDKIAGKFSNGKSAEVYPLVKKLHRLLVEQNPAITRDQVIDTIHSFLHDLDPEFTRLDSMDAISGRGRFWTPSQDAVSKVVRDQATQVRLMGHQIDVEAGRPKPRTGYQPDKMSDAARQEEAKLKELERRYGVVITDPTTQLAGALQARKTYYRNRMTDLAQEIRTREKIVKTKTAAPTDPELESMRTDYARLKAEHDAIFKEPLTDAQRYERAVKAAENEFQRQQHVLADAKLGMFEGKRVKITGPELDRIRAETAVLRAETEALKSLDPAVKSSRAEQALRLRKAAVLRSIAEWQRRISEKDFDRTPRPPSPTDAELDSLKLQREKIVREAKAVENSERLKNRVWWERAGDTLTKIRRAGVLSSIRVIPKLISAGVQRMTTLPLEEAVGSLYRNLPGTRAVAANAPLEGRGMNLGRELRAMRAGFTQGLRDSVAVAKTGSSDLDLELGKPGESYSGERTLGGTVLELPGRSHGAIKAPVKRFGFTRAVEALEEFYAKQEGADGKPLNVQDPMVRARIRVEAYKAANRAIFLQDNFVASKVSNFISERSGNQPVTPYKKAWATAGRVLVPIVKVPTNIVAETFTYAFGLPSAATRLGGRALLKTLGGKMGESIKDLTPEQSDLIMRQLKKGSLGAAALLVGYFNADSVGGYYQPGQKRDSEDVPVGAIRMFGVTVPNWLLHNPLMEVVQFGATVKRVQDSYLRKKDWETQGLGAGVVAAALGLVEEVPFIREMTEVDKLRNPFTRDKFVDQLVSSMIVPGAVSQIAKWTDPADARYPTNLKEWIESGIPVLRQRVPDYK